jgi:hypothetical protein
MWISSILDLMNGMAENISISVNLFNWWWDMSWVHETVSKAML